MTSSLSVIADRPTFRSRRWLPFECSIGVIRKREERAAFFSWPSLTFPRSRQLGGRHSWSKHGERVRRSKLKYCRHYGRRFVGGPYVRATTRNSGPVWPSFWVWVTQRSLRWGDVFHFESDLANRTSRSHDTVAASDNVGMITLDFPLPLGARTLTLTLPCWSQNSLQMSSCFGYISNPNTILQTQPAYSPSHLGHTSSLSPLHHNQRNTIATNSSISLPTLLH